MEPAKRINCNNCVNFYVTWDVKFPYGCRAMKFKSKKRPSTAVLQSSGMPCMLFKRKTAGPKK